MAEARLVLPQPAHHAADPAERLGSTGRGVRVEVEPLHRVEVDVELAAGAGRVMHGRVERAGADDDGPQVTQLDGTPPFELREPRAAFCEVAAKRGQVDRPRPALPRAALIGARRPQPDEAVEGELGEESVCGPRRAARLALERRERDRLGQRHLAKRRGLLRVAEPVLLAPTAQPSRIIAPHLEGDPGHDEGSEAGTHAILVGAEYEHALISPKGVQHVAGLRVERSKIARIHGPRDLRERTIPKR